MKETEIPYKSLDGQPLETRMYALTQLYHAIERLDILNDGAQAAEDVEKTRRLIKKFVNDTMNASGKDAEAGMKVLDDFPEMLEIADVSQESGFQTTKELLQQQRGRLLQPKADYRLIGKGETENVGVAVEKITSLILNAELNKGGGKNKKTPSVDTNSLAAKIFSNSWDNDEELDKTIKTLRQIREKIKARLAADWQVYKKSPSAALKPIEEDIAGIISDKLDIRYTENGNPDKIKNANKKVRDYFTKPLSRTEPLAKTTFLKLMGNLMQAGHDIIHDGTEGQALLRYKEVKSLFKLQYGDTPETELLIDQALGITKQYSSQDELEAARLHAFKEKSKEVYINAVAGLLTKKQEKSGSVPPDYIRNHIEPYMRALRNGSNNVLCLGIVEATESASDWDKLSETKQKILEDKISTIHHKHPIASAITLYMKFNPKLFGDKKPNDLSEMELTDVARNAQKYVNLMGNYCMPIGADVHESMEPHGKYSIEKEKDNTILAARFNKAKVAEIVSRLNLTPTVKKNYVDALNKYSHCDSKGNSLVTMKLPDHKQIDDYRETLHDGQKYSAVRDIAKTATR